MSKIDLTKINRDSDLFTEGSIRMIEKNYDGKYVCDTERQGVRLAVFYGNTERPEYPSRYFALGFNYAPITLKPVTFITNGAFVEDQKFVSVVAENGEILFSRSRHDYRISFDGSVFIDGGRDYSRYNPEKGEVTVLAVKDGEFQVFSERDDDEEEDEDLKYFLK